MKPKTTYIQSVDNTPPVVSDVSVADTQAAYEQRASKRKGLLSTILSNTRPTPKLESPQTGNRTLG